MLAASHNSMVGWSFRPSLAAVVVACLVLSSLGVLGGISAATSLGPSGPVLESSSLADRATTPTSTASAGGLAHALAIENGLRAKGIDPAKVHLPNFPGAVTDLAHTVQPTYSQAPAPMGVSDLGLRNASGMLVPYELNSTSVAGTVDITNLQSLYVDGDGPDTYGIQMNSVAAGVTVFGNSSYEYWSQNYVDYTPSTQQLVFGDEVWNFSSPSGYFPQNSIYNFSVNGTFSAFPYLYQGYGPTITIGYPFSLTLYLNTSTLGDRPAFWFNYTVSNATFHQSESYDYLVFNSTVGTPTSPAPTPYYQANGYHYDPIGLPNDMEIDILGNDDGDTTAFTAADATVSLQYWNASARQMDEVPSAFNAGSETGETSVGLLVTSSGGTNPHGVVQLGPSLLGGLWNVSGSSGSTRYVLHLLPENAFLFVNAGVTLNVSGAQWVPTAPGGTTDFYLPSTGNYYLDFLMSNFDPTNRVEPAAGSPLVVHLTADASQGIYTPLFAFTAAELAEISSAGAGTEANPYVIVHDQYGSLAPEFAQWDNFLFPVFPGLLIADTSSWVDVTPPSFEINIPSWEYGPPYIPVSVVGLPLTNDLQIQFYDAANISLVNAPDISGWLSTFVTGLPESSVMFWNCNNSTVLSNTFEDQGNSLLLYGGTNNTLWGNQFLYSPVVAADPTLVAGGGVSDTGVNETESGDLLYNNLFEVAIPAITPTVDPFPCDQYGICVPTAYPDTWNVSEQPATNSAVVNGWTLTGSIIGTSYQGGNYWSNYGTTSNPYGVLPYNDSGLITVGGDYVPLVPFALYPVTFTEKGLPAGATWNVTENGVALSSSTSTIEVDSPNGTFPLEVSGPSGYVPVNPPDQFEVVGAPARVSLVFAPLERLNVEQTGLLPGIEWTASVNGTGTENTTVSLSNDTYAIDFQVIPGPYNVTAVAPGYNVLPTKTLVTVGVGGATVRFEFTPVPANLTLHVSPATASVWVNNLPVSLSHGNVSVSVPPGMVTVEATAAGFYPYFTNFTVTSGTSPAINVDLRPIFPGVLVVSVVPASATVLVNGSPVILSSGVYTASKMPGLYVIEVVASGYYPYYNNVTVTSNTTTSVPVLLDAVPPTSSAVLGVSPTGWAAIAVLAALAAIFLVGMVYFARRPRRGTGAAAPPPAQPWQEPPPNPPPPSS